MNAPASTTPAFAHDQFLARRKVLSMLGAKFHFYDTAGRVIGFCKQKAFKLREDIRLYSDESMSRELLLIKARNIMDISAIFDVTDATTGERVGAIRRRGLKSIVRDEWVILDSTDREIGLVQEESAIVAMLRRFIELIPQTFVFSVGGQVVGKAEQNFNPFVLKLSVDLTPDRARMLDRRLAAAAIILLLAVEGRQG